MATENTASASTDLTGGFLAELLQVRVYKPALGRIARQVTCGVVWLAFALGAWRWYATNYGLGLFGDAAGPNRATVELMRFLMPGAFLVAGMWLGYRAVNYPRFADFLIAVEAEMNKVTWPSQAELIRSSMVVIFLLAAMTILLYAFDVIWSFIFVWIGIR